MSKKQIDINSLSKSDLYDLNERIIERIKELSRQEASQHLSKYSLSDIVSFNYEGEIQYGIVRRVNQRSLSLQMTDGSEIRISPSFVRKELNPPKKILNLRKKLFPTPEEFVEELRKKGLISPSLHKRPTSV